MIGQWCWAMNLGVASMVMCLSSYVAIFDGIDIGLSHIAMDEQGHVGVWTAWDTGIVICSRHKHLSY